MRPVCCQIIVMDWGQWQDAPMGNPFNCGQFPRSPRNPIAGRCGAGGRFLTLPPSAAESQPLQYSICDQLAKIAKPAGWPGCCGWALPQPRSVGQPFPTAPG